jgi:hypothetical protein
VPPAVRSHVLLVEKLFGGFETHLEIMRQLTTDPQMDRESDLVILYRVATDPKMRHVWRYLVRFEATDDALVNFFDCAWQQARFPWFVETPKDRAALAAPWTAAAALCRWSNAHQIAARTNPELAAALVRVADHFEEVARRKGNLDSPLVVSHRSARPPRAFRAKAAGGRPHCLP